jgi:hypothetical protein
MNNVIDELTLDASKIYDAFLSAVALPDFYSKEAVQLVINTLQRDLAKDPFGGEITNQYIKYLETLICSR